MKVLYDHQIFAPQEFGGISRYFAELMQNRVGYQVELALVHTTNVHLRGSNRFPGRTGLREDWYERTIGRMAFRGRGRIHALLRKAGLVPKWDRVNLRGAMESIRRGEFDVFHPTYFDPYFLEVIGGKPFVVTVFDMIHETYPDLFRREAEVSVGKKALCERAAKVIAISHATKSDLIRILGIEDAKIDVIHLASSLQPGPSKTSSLVVPGRYILYVGQRTGYKNFAAFLEAIAEILRDDRNLFLVCAGPAFTRAEIDLVLRAGVRAKVRHVLAGDGELARLYRDAELFAFPSLYEGFGLPLLEAFSCGCPVAASNIPVFHEVAGDAAVYFQPEDAASMTHAVETLLHEPTLRRTMIDRGHRRNRQFSWEKTAAHTCRTYEKACL